MNPATKPKMYSFVQAAKRLPFSYRKLYEWYQNGTLKPIMTDPSRKKLTEDEVNKIEKLAEPPKDSLSFTEIVKYFSTSTITLQTLIDNYNIQPEWKHEKNKIGPKHDYYSMKTVNNIAKLLLAKRQSHNKALTLTPNTDHMYNRKTDYTESELCRLLGYGVNNNKILFQWIQYHRIDGQYSIDKSGKLFFTKSQAEYIKNHFGKLPTNTYGNNKDIAKALHIYENQVITFRRYYKIPAYKVLGHRDVYYSNETAKTFIDWYQNPNHRPYPYHPNSKKYKHPETETIEPEAKNGILYLNDHAKTK